MAAERIFHDPTHILSADKDTSPERNKGFIIPHLKEAFDFISRYENSPSEPRRQGHLKQLALLGVGNLEVFSDILDNIGLILSKRQDLKDQPETRDAYVLKMRGEAIAQLHRVIETSNISRWTPDVIEEVVRQSLESEGTKRMVADAIKTGIFEAPEKMFYQREMDTYATIDKSVELHYNATYAMVNTDNEAVREELFSILCGEKDWFCVHHPSVILAHTRTPDYPRTQEGRNKQLAFYGVLNYCGLIMEEPDDFNRVFMGSGRVAKKLQEIGKIAIALTDVDSQFARAFYKRFKGSGRKISEFIDSLSALRTLATEDQGQRLDFLGMLKETRQVRSQDYPPDVEARINSIKSDPLVRLTHEKLAPRIAREFCEYQKSTFRTMGYVELSDHIQITNNLQLQIMAKDCATPEAIKQTVREVFHTLVSGRAVNPNREVDVDLDKTFNVKFTEVGYSDFFDKDGSIVFSIFKNHESDFGKLGSIIKYHRPDIPANQLDAGRQGCELVAGDIKTKINRSIGKRGYEVTITDPDIRSYGYNSITFKDQASSSSILASIRINDKSFEFLIGPDYRLAEGRDVKGFAQQEDKVWLELLALSHLKTLLCTEQEKIEDGSSLFGGDKLIERFKRQYRGKGEHLRPLNPLFFPGGFTPQADVYFRESEMVRMGRIGFKTLRELNAARREQGQEDIRIRTFVRPDNLQLSEHFDPLKIAFADATVDLRRAIVLGDISPEELKRIEKLLLEGN